MACSFPSPLLLVPPFLCPPNLPCRLVAVTETSRVVNIQMLLKKHITEQGCKQQLSTPDASAARVPSLESQLTAGCSRRPALCLHATGHLGHCFPGQYRLSPKPRSTVHHENLPCIHSVDIKAYSTSTSNNNRYISIMVCNCLE
jgi:hypothetical protein